MKSTIKPIDTYQRITAYVMENMEQGEIIWRKPWNNLGMPKNIATNRCYKGWNVFFLNFVTAFQEYKTPYFMTYKQARERGGTIRKGAKGYRVVWWATIEDKTRPLEHPQGKEKYVTFRVPKVHTVFNIDQVLGVEYPGEHLLFRSHFFKIEACEKVLAGMPERPQICHTGDQAFYNPTKDIITMPSREIFHNDEAYYHTLFHELAHSTGHQKRLNRKDLVQSDSFGSESYSREELTAELTAAFLCGICGIEAPTIANSTAYIRGWLKSLRNDKKMILKAAAQAQAACDFILTTQPDFPGQRRVLQECLLD